jgi:GntR family transcriptional regulator
MAVRQPTLPRLPGKSPLGSYIYVVHFNVGVIKVGFTRKPTDRIGRYRSNLSPFGIAIVDMWLSEPHGQAEDNERLLLDFCRARAEDVSRGEYFTGIGFREVVTFASTLPYVPLQAGPVVSAPASPPQPQGEQIDEGPVTPYRQLADILKARIARGDWAEGRPIASETRLVQEYGLARSTVRRALDLLVEEQVVWKVQGRGTYVGQPPAENS